MRSPVILLVLMFALASPRLYAVHSEELRATANARLDVPHQGPHGTLLPNGWVLHPAGRQIPTGDLPLAMTLSPDGDYLLVSTGGYAPARVTAIDTFYEQAQFTQTLDSLWEGMAFGPDQGPKTQLYVSGGGRGLIWRFAYDPRGGDLVREAPLLPAGLVGREAPYVRPQRDNANSWIAGLAVDPGDGTLYALNNQQATLLALDPETGAERTRASTGDHPTALLLLPDHRRLCVANQGGASVSIFETHSLKKVGDVPVGLQPAALLADREGRRLFVADSGSDAVSVVDPDALQVRETIRTTLFPQAPAGSSPNALALSPDGGRLFVANAGNNDVAVIDVSNPGSSRVLGFIPTGWYPTTVAVSKDGKKLFVGVGKGLSGMPSYPRVGGGVGLNIYNKLPDQAYGPKHDHAVAFDYICSLLRGQVSVIDMPDEAQLARYTRQVIDGCPYRDALLARAAEPAPQGLLPTPPGKRGPIQHLLYIIKENRTYDQVFGDIKEGNGDPDLVLFGEKVTPNHHALARQYVLLDNLYCDGEVSEDGHQWCNAANCTDWTEKVYPGNYATPSRGDAPGSEAVTTSAGGYLWDDCARHGLTYRTYGEFTSFHSDKDAPPTAASGSPNLKGHISVGWEVASRSLRRDYKRVEAFVEELKAAEKTGKWPNYMVMSLGEDHTVGLTPGLPTPWAAVASNDVALGRIVEAVSHSRFWSSTAIFVIEDDAQAGPDHVDAHRTVGLVVSPYVKRRSVDHTLYTTSSFVRTMELLLGLPPMTQFDAGAAPLFRSLTGRPNLAPYMALPARTDLEAMNPRKGAGAKVSLRLDFRAYDRCPPEMLNKLLWHAVKGEDAAYPTPIRGANAGR